MNKSEKLADNLVKEWLRKCNAMTTSGEPGPNNMYAAGQATAKLILSGHTPYIVRDDAVPILVEAIANALAGTTLESF